MLPLLFLVNTGLAAAPDAPAVRVHRAEGAIDIDGVMDEADWARAAPVTDFKRYVPAEGGPAPGITEVRFLQDDRALYIGVRVADAGYRIRARVSPREDINADDQVGIYLDTFGDERTGYIFYVSALGIQQDIRFNNGDWNPNWNTVLYSRGRATEDGYILEIELPFRSIRYPSDRDPQTWGLILTRKVFSEGAKYAFPEVDRNHPRWFSQAARLEGVEPAHKGAGLEILPVLALRQDAARPASGEPLDWSGLDPWHEAVRPGLDLRLGLGPDAGLAATVNPDFSQVEGDAAQLDLNPRFALFYPERRPFFLDGIDAFEDIQETLYTRSIVEPLYGVKVSAHQGRFTVGALQALDRNPGPSLHEEGAPGFSEADLEDTWASNAYGRVRMDAFDGGYVGLTTADKRVTGTGAWNDVVGADAVVPLSEYWTAGAVLSGSTTGDGQGEALIGHEAGVEIGHSSERWNAQVRLLDSGPGFRKEMGFLNRSGVTEGLVRSGYNIEPAVDWLDLTAIGGWVEAARDREGDTLRSLGLFQRGVIDGVHQPSAAAWVFDQTEAGVALQGWGMELDYGTEPARFLALEIGGETGTELDYEQLIPARTWELSSEASVRIGAGVRVHLSYQRGWFTPEGALTETGAALRSRFYWQFTRNLGLRLIGQTTTGDGFDTSQLDTSYLLTWLRNPGTEAYLGATQVVTLDDRTALREQVLFAKLSWLFRV